MSRLVPHPRQAPLASWVSQILGTVVLAGVVLWFVGAMGAPFAQHRLELQRHALWIVVAAALPSMLYLPIFRERLAADEKALRIGRDVPEPGARRRLMAALAIGGALCELPMAIGALHLLLGGDTRDFVGATLLTLALRVSYRPFGRAAR